jgi:hypothetical protein
MGKVTYARVTEAVDVPRPFYDENMENAEFSDLTKGTDRAIATADEKPSL